MLKRYGIQLKLVIGFAVAPVLMLILVFFGVQRVKSIDRSLTQINDINAVKQRYAINFRGSVHDRAISLRDVVLSRDANEVSKSLDEIKVLAGFYAESAKPLDEIFATQTVSDDEKTLLAGIKNIEEQTLPLIEKVIRLHQEDNKSEAHRVLMEEAKPAFITWLARINKFIDYQEALTKKDSTFARSTAAENTQTLGSLNIQSVEVRKASESLSELVGDEELENKKAA